MVRQLLDRLEVVGVDRATVALGPPVLAEHAPVDLRDPQAGRLELVEAERRLVVHGLREVDGARADARDHLAPHVDDRVLPLGNLDEHRLSMPRRR